MMDKITVASVNCRGLGNVQKRRDVFHYLRQKRYSIYFLQDTHLDPKLDKYITAEWGFTLYFCSNNTRSRGVAIPFNNHFECQIFSDNGGKKNDGAYQHNENGCFARKHISGK